MTTSNEKLAINAINAFVREMKEKRENLKTVSYKTVVNFFSEMNKVLGYDYFKMQTNEGELHTYSVKNRLRCNDSYKNGLYIDMQIGDKHYSYHTKQAGAAWNMNNFVLDALQKGGISIIVEIRKIKAGV